MRENLTTAALRLLHKTRLLPHLMRRLPFRKVLGSEGRALAWRLLGAHLAADVKLSPRVYMRIPSNVSVGYGSRLNGRVWIDAWGKVAIGSNVQINGELDLYTADHDVDSPDLRGSIRSIEIGDYAWLANRIIVLPGVTIGQCAVVGSGAVVSRSVPDYGVAVGNPARVVKERARTEFSYRPSDF
jgi:acetyltransferase-like isoleucine patch superfamily enzyme